jgi:hypothetical protein
MLVTGNTGTMSRKFNLTLMAVASTSSTSGRRHARANGTDKGVGARKLAFDLVRDRRSQWAAEGECTLQSGCAQPGLLETPENSKGLFHTTPNTAARYGVSQHLRPRTMARRRTPIFHVCSPPVRRFSEYFCLVPRPQNHSRMHLWPTSPTPR